MTVEFDPAKDAENQRKHGISLADAARLDLDIAAIIPDDRQEYREARLRAYGYIEHRLYMLAFTMRGEVLRAISLRKANAREAKRYGQETRKTGL